MSIETTTESVLTPGLLEACRGRAALYDRENRFFQDDFDALKEAGYLRMAVPRELGGLGLNLAQVARETDIDTGVVGDKAVHLPRQVVLHVTRREQHARYRKDAPGAAGRQLGEPVADRRTCELEIAGGKIDRWQPPPQRLGERLEFTDRLGIAAAMAADQHRRPAHRLAHRLTRERPRPRVALP